MNLFLQLQPKPLADARLQLAYDLAKLARGPLALRAAKQAMIQGPDMTLGEGMQLEQRLFRQMLATEDAKEGPMAFAQKRKPEFKGC